MSRLVQGVARYIDVEVQAVFRLHPHSFTKNLERARFRRLHTLRTMRPVDLRLGLLRWLRRCPSQLVLRRCGKRYVFENVNLSTSAAFSTSSSDLRHSLRRSSLL